MKFATDKEREYVFDMAFQLIDYLRHNIVPPEIGLMALLYASAQLCARSEESNEDIVGAFTNILLGARKREQEKQKKMMVLQ